MLHLRCSPCGKVGIASSSRKLDVAMPFETTNAGPAAPPLQQSSGFAPLKIPLFRDRWIASTVSSVGTWMQDTAGTWLMTSLTASPLLIALMQTAASLPVLLLGLLAGVDACLGWHPRDTHLCRLCLALGAAGLYLSAEHRLGDEQPCLAGDRPGARSA